MKKHDIVKFIFFLILIVLIGGIGVFISPYISELNNLEDAKRLLEPIHNLGFGGVLVFITLQLLQVIIFVIPGEVLEVLGGMLYGTVLGFFLCMFGIAIGTVIIFSISKKLGVASTKSLFKNDDHKLLRFLEKNNRMEALLFLLFFIPGTPKDALTYFAPFLDISIKKFLFITLIARIPSVLSSTFIGSQLLDGNITIAVVLYAIIGIIAVVVYIYNKRLDTKKM